MNTWWIFSIVSSFLAAAHNDLKHSRRLQLVSQMYLFPCGKRNRKWRFFRERIEYVEDKVSTEQNV